MAIKVGINGFGRIGRNIMRAALGNANGTIDFVAVNDITSPETLAYLLKHDSVLGNLDADVTVKDGGIRVGGKSFAVLSERNPAALPWQDLGVDIVVESTGLFTKRENAAKHLDAGAKKVIITAPAKGPDPTREILPASTITHPPGIGSAEMGKTQSAEYTVIWTSKPDRKRSKRTQHL